ncbi:MAG TPA: lipocalin family protein [Chitinophagaceae bacterium]|nr:lipocalin family protein [Chitinophagaceae bacterium]
MKKFFLIAAVSLLAFSSCNKDDDDTCDITVANIAGTYKLTGLTYKANSSAQEQDFLIFIDACERDDLHILNSNGSFTYQDAGTVCSPDGSYTGGTWTLTGNVIDIDGNYSGTIQSFDCRNLVMVESDVLNTGDRFTATFVKQ